MQTHDTHPTRSPRLYDTLKSRLHGKKSQVALSLLSPSLLELKALMLGGGNLIVKDGAELARTSWLSIPRHRLLLRPSMASIASLDASIMDRVFYIIVDDISLLEALVGHMASLLDAGGAGAGGVRDRIDGKDSEPSPLRIVLGLDFTDYKGDFMRALALASTYPIEIIGLHTDTRNKSALEATCHAYYEMASLCKDLSFIECGLDSAQLVDIDKDDKDDKAEGTGGVLDALGSSKGTSEEASDELCLDGLLATLFTHLRASSEPTIVLALDSTLSMRLLDEALCSMSMPSDEEIAAIKAAMQGGGTMPSMPTPRSIEAGRAMIDRLDASIMLALKERFAIVSTLNEIKDIAGLPRQNSAREAMILTRIDTLGAYSKEIERVYKEVFEISKGIEPLIRTEHKAEDIAACPFHNQK